MNKKILACVLSAVLTLSLFAGCKQETSQQQASQQASDNGIKLWYAYNTENLMQDLEYPDLMAQRDYTLRIHGVRNDAEPVQLMITPGKNVIDYNLTMADLTSGNGDTFAAENFGLFAVYYAEVTESYNTDSYYGFYPDALVPMENYIAMSRNYIEAGNNQAIWVQANIPADQNPGHYTGSAVLTIDGENYTIPVELTVYDAEIPVENHMPSSYGIWWNQIAYGEGYYSEELAQAYWDFLVAKRTMPDSVPPHISTNLDTYIDYLAQLAENPAISSYRLINDVAEYELGKIVDRNSMMRLLAMLAEKNIELREAGNESIDLFKKAFFYLGNVIDEPTGPSLQRVRDCDLIITECKTEIADTYFKDKYPDLYESCMGLRHLVTTGYNPDLVGSDTVGGVQTWCPQYQHWHTEAQRQEYYARMNTTDRLMGEQAWWYGCNNPKTPYPTYHLDDQTIAPRVLFWMQFAYGVQGDLYYAINIVNHSDNAYPWTDVYYDDAANDGRLTYPGDKFGVFGPISTMRMENIFQGREDYECLLQIRNAILAYNDANGTDYDPQELMAYLYEGLFEGAIPERDNAEGFAGQRIAMLELLEQFNTDPAAALETMENG